MSIVWLDGELVDKADAKVGVADHGLLFGDGVTADMRAYGGRVFRLEQHLERLQEWADDIGLSLPIAGKAIGIAIDATLEANSRTDGFVKVVVTRGSGPLTLDPRKCMPVTIILAEEAAPFPRELYDCGLNVVTRPVRYDLSPANQLGHVLRAGVKHGALQAGCLEGIAVVIDGTVAGGSETDVGLVTSGQVRFGPGGGVTHVAVCELAGGESRYSIHVDDLTTADEVFLTSAAAEIIGVRSIDGKLIGNGGEGPVTRRLREAFAAMVRTGDAVS